MASEKDYAPALKLTLQNLFSEEGVQTSITRDGNIMAYAWNSAIRVKVKKLTNIKETNVMKLAKGIVGLTVFLRSDNRVNVPKEVFGCRAIYIDVEVSDYYTVISFHDYSEGRKGSKLADVRFNVGKKDFTVDVEIRGKKPNADRGLAEVLFEKLPEELKKAYS